MGRYSDDQMIEEHYESIANEHRYKPVLQCDECGYEFEEGDDVFKFDGICLCRDCVVEHAEIYHP